MAKTDVLARRELLDATEQLVRQALADKRAPEGPLVSQVPQARTASREQRVLAA